MSEEILKALMQLFALISKQDDGVSHGIVAYVEDFLKFQLPENKVQEYLNLFNQFNAEEDKKKKAAEDKPKKEKEGETTETSAATEETSAPKLTSVKDSVRILAICKKINKTLAQKQKFIVLIRLWDLLREDGNFTPQRIQIINTVATAFNIDKYEVKLIEQFCSHDSIAENNFQDILVITENTTDIKSLPEAHIKFINTDSLDKNLFILRIPSEDLFFIKYPGQSEIYLNGLLLNSKHINVLAAGSTLKIPSGAIYYTDLLAKFANQNEQTKIALQVENLEYKFPNGNVALRGVSFTDDGGRLVAIMGASGAGKTTLLNVISGIEKPSNGKITINGLDLVKDYQKVKGLIGYIAQDDLLFEDLTVFENLFYSAKLSFKDKEHAELIEMVGKTLQSLGLFAIKDIKVGSPLNKKISGGQRKRLNIALELIREPAILFVDEPTSGLSSKDSENVVELLKELSLRGKLIYVVIHQPSSDIFKMFDRLIVLDTGGYQIYTGNPIDAVVYFKTETKQINPDVGECHICGNVNPELIFNIIEAKVVDDYGRFTPDRKITPTEWTEKFKKKFTFTPLESTNQELPASANIPNKITQWLTFIQRDVKSKVGNLQYMLLNLLEAPVLALVLALLIRYRKGSPTGEYSFYYNQNLPAYIFVCIIVSLFIGLTISAEEIFRDRKILKREKFLNLSRGSYLLSKITILFTLSAIQTLLFVLIGNFVLDIQGMYLPYWITLFTVSCFANTLGLNISSAFNSAVTIYIIIPLLVIPQMVLGGAMFSFDKLNDWFGGGNEKTPLISDFFVSRWAYEGLSVYQYKSNNYEKKLYAYNKLESFINYRTSYVYPKLTDLKAKCKRQTNSTVDSIKKSLAENDKLFSNVLKNELSLVPANIISPPNYSLTGEAKWKNYGRVIDDLNTYYSSQFTLLTEQKNKKLTLLAAKLKQQGIDLKNFKNKYVNEYLSDVVTNGLEKQKFRQENYDIVQLSDPIYRDPKPANKLDFRAHMFAPRKNLFGKLIDTFTFNILVIWSMTLILFIALYFDLLARLLNIGNKIPVNKNQKT